MSQPAAGDAPGPIRATRTPKCSRCRNHGLVVPVRGHSGRCAWKMCTCSKCSLIAERHKILTADKELRKSGPRGDTPEESVPAEVVTGETHSEAMQSAERHPETGPALLPLESAPGPEYFERDPSKMYIGCPPMYHYSPFPMGLAVAPPRFQGAAPPAGIALQDGGGEFRPAYYHSVPQFIPPGFVPGLHYLPPPLPMSVNIMAEPSKDMLGQSSRENPSFKPTQERTKEPST
ncbi:doublesex- and mab-3-related transcription factor B1 [Spea bombifrons]|uniref:doublesex- and mab-3-related transcription factor B1 n=1 Tax=Spea bombifrons TaxID=233779 RepID=UPI00234975C3|nr:doublesex- and mab-3-related transcription factor B1 [Spea bombifrons]